MALLKFKDIQKMDKKAKETKLSDLKLELIKANVTANKTNAKTKEIKRAISRLHTFNKSHKDELKTKQKHD
jgi:ribosomal protein L29